MHRETTGFFYYRNTLTTGIADGQFYFGDPGDRFVSGDWGVVDDVDTPAVFRPSNGRFYLRFENSQGNADVDFEYGNSNVVAVAGAFGVLPGGSVPPPSNATWTLPVYDGFALPGGARAEALQPGRLEYVDVSQPDDPEYDPRLAVDGIPAYMVGDWIVIPSKVGPVILSYFLDWPEFMWALERPSADDRIYLSGSLHFAMRSDDELLSTCWSDFYGGPVVAVVDGWGQTLRSIEPGCSNGSPARHGPAWRDLGSASTRLVSICRES